MTPIPKRNPAPTVPLIILIQPLLRSKYYFIKYFSARFTVWYESDCALFLDEFCGKVEGFFSFFLFKFVVLKREIYVHLRHFKEYEPIVDDCR